MLSVFLLNVVVLNVVAPPTYPTRNGPVANAAYVGF
jgi:hypothetical protein